MKYFFDCNCLHGDVNRAEYKGLVCNSIIEAAEKFIAHRDLAISKIGGMGGVPKSPTLFRVIEEKIIVEEIS